MDRLLEWYEPDGDPREALGRYARRLRGGGALYLGGGIGVESVRRMGNNNIPLESYSLVPSGTKFDGPLSAVTAAFTAAGKSTSVDTPGGATPIAEASIAARLHELDASEREEKSTIVRYEARAARRAKEGVTGYTSGSGAALDDSWELRRLEEARANLSAIATERKRLMEGKLAESSVVRLRVPSLPTTVELGGAAGVSLLGELHEAEQGKPGTNWKQVTPKARKQLGGILQHYKGMAKPFTQCVADNRKRFGDRAERVCAVVKDLNERTTKWRKGPKGDSKVAEELLALVTAAEHRLEAVDMALGEGAVQQIVANPERLRESEQRGAAALAEIVEADVILLHLNGDERATTVLEANARTGTQHRHRGGQFANVTDRVAKGGEVPTLLGPDGVPRANTPHPEPEPVSESGLLDALIEAR